MNAGEVQRQRKVCCQSCKNEKVSKFFSLRRKFGDEVNDVSDAKWDDRQDETMLLVAERRVDD